MGYWKLGLQKGIFVDDAKTCHDFRDVDMLGSFGMWWMSGCREYIVTDHSWSSPQSTYSRYYMTQWYFCRKERETPGTRSTMVNVLWDPEALKNPARLAWMFQFNGKLNENTMINPSGLGCSIFRRNATWYASAFWGSPNHKHQQTNQERGKTLPSCTAWRIFQINSSYNMVDFL